jgi:hypothetical protein
MSENQIQTDERKMVFINSTLVIHAPIIYTYRILTLQGILHDSWDYIEYTITQNMSELIYFHVGECHSFIA